MILDFQYTVGYDLKEFNNTLRTLWIEGASELELSVKTKVLTSGGQGGHSCGLPLPIKPSKFVLNIMVLPNLSDIKLRYATTTYKLNFY